MQASKAGEQLEARRIALRSSYHRTKVAIESDANQIEPPKS